MTTASSPIEPPTKPRWPGKARLAVQFVINYEEGGENCVLHGDPASEAFLSEIVAAQPLYGVRHISMESIYEYGSRAGFWRLWCSLRLWAGGPAWFLWMLRLWDALAAGVYLPLRRYGDRVLRRNAAAREQALRERAPDMVLVFRPETETTEGRERISSDSAARRLL